MGSGNKGSWYKLLINKMDAAIDDKYYFEAVFIEYMIIDDRMKTLAKMAGLDLKNPDGKPKMLGQLIDEVKLAKKNQTIAQWELLDVGIPPASKEVLKSIKKVNYPKKMVNDCIHVPRTIINVERSKKSGNLISKYGQIDNPLLNQIKKWVEERNHWMHAAGDDALTQEEYEEEITPLAIDGDSFVRELCDVVKKIRRGIQRME